jgi:hypothetical protein
VSIVGGIFNDDRVLALADDQLTVTDHGKTHSHTGLAPSALRRVWQLADEVAGLSVPLGKAADSVDGGTTTIEISAKKAARIVLAAGDDAPEPIWALLDSVEGLCRDEEDEGASSGGRGKREG